MYKLILQIQTNVNGLSPVEPDCWKNVDPTIQNILIHAIATNYKERKTAREISLLFDADLVSTVAPPISVVAIEPQTSQKDVILPQSTAISSGQTLFDTPLTSNVSVTTAIIRPSEQNANHEKATDQLYSITAHKKRMNVMCWKRHTFACGTLGETKRSSSLQEQIQSAELPYLFN